jgi:membrane protein implicated in regulation of membrane protease activity
MSQAGKLFGSLVVILFIVFVLPLILPIVFLVSSPAQPSLTIDNIFLIFWGYRWYDMIFLSLAIFAAIAGLSSLFRAENPEVHVEEAVTEGYVEEAVEEEQ